MTATDPIVILSYARTPMGSFQGALAGASATELGAAAVRAAVERAGLSGEEVDKIFMGCVLPAGLGQAPARQAALGAGLPRSVEATTINKVCGSGMQAAMFAHDMLAAGSADLIVAGGMESMSNSPYLMKKHRSGARIGHDTVYDHMMLDGLEDAYDAGRAMGTFAEDSAREYQFTRGDQDDYAIESLRRATAAIASGAFEREIVPVTVKTRKGEDLVSIDEQPGKSNPEKIPGLKPAFAKDGTITAGTASQISDGACAVVVMSKAKAEELGLEWIAEIGAHGVVAGPDASLHEQPSNAIRAACAKEGIDPADLDLIEINEAFAAVGLASAKELGVPADIVNPNGGAIAIGHPIGMSGARLTLHLALELQRRGGGIGVAALCGGGGQGDALILRVPKRSGDQSSTTSPHPTSAA
jgi:acetyl-CoA C-acetyltransferase